MSYINSLDIVECYSVNAITEIFSHASDGLTSFATIVNRLRRLYMAVLV